MNRLLLVLLLWLGLISQAMALPSTTATVVYGQLGSFTTNTANNGGISADSLDGNYGVVRDATGGLYVSDYNNNRVLHYPAGSTIADRVYGQGGSFTTNTQNNGGISANSLWGPRLMATDSDGGLYVADYRNSRVLHYPAGSTTADRVYGQGGIFTTGTVNKGGISANSLAGPTSVAVDSDGGLYVGDLVNFRVLHYPAGSTTADRVYGQGGSFITMTPNKGGISANSLAQTQGLAVDSAGGLYVGDLTNNRVLHYPAGSTTADRVYGQGGIFTTNTPNNGGISANSLNGVGGVVVDSTGGLYVSDIGNHRILHYPAGSTTADWVSGQGGSFTTRTQNNEGISANSLYLPRQIVLDSDGGLYVADTNNNRALYYPAVPAVSAVSPDAGPSAGGTSITITGTGFTGATAVTVGGSACDSFSVDSATSITCTTPAGTPGAASILVTTPGGTNAANTLYAYAPVPAVTAVSPGAGPTAGGTSITITGTGFTSATAVTVGGSACDSFSVDSATSITCTTPAGSAGSASILVTTPGGTNAANTLYAYESGVVITSVAPDNGSTEGGTIITITGSGFTGATSVTIGGQACTNLIVISDSILTCTSPPGVPGNATIEITTPAGATTAPTEYVYTPAPVVSAVAPDTGPLTGGTAITLTGSDFTGATAVTIGGNACTNLVVVSATTITCTTPASSSAGSASILVTTPGGTSAATTVFTYTAANPIPTLGEWAQIMMMLSLMAMAGWKSRRIKPG